MKNRHWWLKLAAAYVVALGGLPGCKERLEGGDEGIPDGAAMTVDMMKDTPADERCDAKFNGPTDPAALVDDLEDGNGLIPMIGDRNGGWWITSDGTDGTITPQAEMTPPGERILGGRCDSQYAMRATGEGFTDWGAVLSLGFRYTDRQESIDVSGYKGIQFWARVGESNTSAVRVQLQDSTTHMEGGLCSDVPGSSDECWNGWGTQIAPLSTEWQLYQIRFDSLSQRDYGLRGDALDETRVYALDINLDPNSVFDVWIDDIWFYE